MSTRSRASSAVSGNNVFVTLQDIQKESLFSKVHKRRRNSSITVTAVPNTFNKNNVKNNEIQIVNWDNLDEWQQDNEFIYDGYVKETSSVMGCIKSLNILHNESVNIWSHLVPSVIYLALLIGFTDFILEKKLIQILGAGHHLMDAMDYVMINIFLVGAFLCLFCSSCYHCFKQHSESVSVLWSKADYMGIIILISTSIISLLYYGFHDHLFLCKLFTIITTIFGATCCVFVLNDKFNHKDWKIVRASFFVLFAASGLLPIFTGFFVFGIENSIKRVQLLYVFFEAICYIAGALIYGFKIPECYFKPGKFDYFFNSHQIFHLCCVAGSVFHFRAVIASFVYAKTGIHSNSVFIF
ncbi:hypothetical protein QEN19_000181 [Hanseniaspora menglaensis]